MEIDGLQILKDQEIGSQKHEEKEETLKVAPKEMPPELLTEMKKELKGSNITKEQAERFLNAMNARVALANAEKAAKGKVLQEFVPANRGRAGWKERQTDEKRLAQIKRETNNKNLSLYGMRISERFQHIREEEQNEIKEESPLASVIDEAIGWKLSWSMIDLRYFWHNQAAMHDMFSKAVWLKSAMENNDPAILALPEKNREVLAAVLNVVFILRDSVHGRLLENGYDMRVGVMYKLTRPKGTEENTCKELFDQGMKELARKEREANLSPHEFTALTEKEWVSEFSDLTAKEIPALLEKNQEQEVSQNHKRYIYGPIACLKMLRNDSPEKTLSVFRNLRNVMNISALSDDEKKACCKELEAIFREIMSWDMSEFEFHSTDDFTKQGIAKKRTKLYLCFELANMFGKYKEVFNTDREKKYVSFSDELFNVFSARLSACQALHSFYHNGMLLFSSEKLMKERSFSDWLKLSGEELITLGTTVTGDTEEERKNMSDCLVQFGSMKQNQEAGENYYLPGTNYSEFLKKEQENLGVNPDQADDVLFSYMQELETEFIHEFNEHYKTEKALLEQESATGEKKLKPHEIAHQAEKRAGNHIKPALSEKIKARMEGWGPDETLRLLLKMGNISHRYPTYKNYSESFQTPFNDILYDIIVEYIKTHMGKELLDAYINARHEASLKIHSFIKENKDANLHPELLKPLKQHQGESDEQFRMRKLRQKGEYLTMLLKEKEPSLAYEITSLVNVESDMSTMYCSPGRTIPDDDGQKTIPVSLQLASDVTTPVLDDLLLKSIQDEDERNMVKIIAQSIGIRDSLSSLDQTAVESLSQEIDGKMKGFDKEMEKDALRLFL